MKSDKSEREPFEFSDEDNETITLIKERVYNMLLLGVNNETERLHAESFSSVFAVLFNDVVSQLANGTTNIVEVAESLSLAPEMIRKLSETQEWKVAMNIHLGTGDRRHRFQTDERHPVPVPLQERYLLQEVFQKFSDVRLVTYDSFIDARVKEVSKYILILEDGRFINKIDVILAFPQDRMYYVKKGIKRRKSVADLGLKPIPNPRDRPKIAVNARIGDEIECVMRNGLVITGENIWISKYNIVLRVGGKKDKGGKVVLLYKHALHAFGVIQEKPQRQHVGDNDAFDEESDDGK